MSGREFWDIIPDESKSLVEVEADIAFMTAAFGEERVTPCEDGGVMVYATIAELHAVFENLLLGDEPTTH